MCKNVNKLTAKPKQHNDL